MRIHHLKVRKREVNKMQAYEIRPAAQNNVTGVAAAGFFSVYHSAMDPSACLQTGFFQW